MRLRVKLLLVLILWIVLGVVIAFLEPGVYWRVVGLVVGAFVIGVVLFNVLWAVERRAKELGLAISQIAEGKPAVNFRNVNDEFSPIEDALVELYTLRMAEMEDEAAMVWEE